MLKYILVKKVWKKTTTKYRKRLRHKKNWSKLVLLQRVVFSATQIAFKSININALYLHMFFECFHLSSYCNVYFSGQIQIQLLSYILKQNEKTFRNGYNSRVDVLSTYPTGTKCCVKYPIIKHDFFAVLFTCRKRVKFSFICATVS